MKNFKLKATVLSTLALTGMVIGSNAQAQAVSNAAMNNSANYAISDASNKAAKQQKYLLQFAADSVALKTLCAKKDQVNSKANALANLVGVTVSKVYANSGMASVMATPAQLAQLKQNGNIVNIVRADAKVDIAIPKVKQSSTIEVPLALKSQSTGSWGIDRIDQLDRNYDGQYNAPFDGSDVIVYVMDSGVEMDHPMLKDRVAYTKNTYNPDAEAFDCHGHGTHVIGTVGVQDYGVAPGATLVAVRPFNDNCGAGTQESFVGAIEFAVEDSQAKGKRAVVNMSLGYTADSPDSPLDFFETAIAAGIDAGVVMVTSTGNDSLDTCGQAIGRMPEVISVAGSRVEDLEYMFTNDGECVDIYAPGVDIVSMDWFSHGVRAMTGTSMASPHVAGAAALVLEAFPEFTPVQVRDYLIAQSNKDVIRSFDGHGAPNRLLYVGDIGGGIVLEPDLKPGVPMPLDSDKDSEQVFSMDVPAGKAQFDVTTAGDNGDADLYVSFGSVPTTTHYDCRSYAGGSNESCRFENPQAGTYHIMVRAYNAFTDVALTADYSGDVGGGVDCNVDPSHPDCPQTGEGINESDLTSSDMIVRTIDVTAGQTLSVNTLNGEGDADLFVNFGSQASEWWEAECTSRSSGNNESCVIENTQAGTYHITVKAYQGELFSGLTLTANAQ